MASLTLFSTSLLSPDSLFSPDATLQTRRQLSIIDRFSVYNASFLSFLTSHSPSPFVYVHHWACPSVSPYIQSSVYPIQSVRLSGRVSVPAVPTSCFVPPTGRTAPPLSFPRLSQSPTVQQCVHDGFNGSISSPSGPKMGTFNSGKFRSKNGRAHRGQLVDGYSRRKN